MVWLILPVVLILVFLFLIFPGRASGKSRALFEGRAYAHRGLYTSDQSIPENSLPAFRRAVEAGYGAELDVQMTKDNRVVVLHDDNLKRACGVDGRVCDFTLEELKEFPLFGTDERIPLFSDVLEVFGGRQPLIVELKFAAPNVMDLCAAVRKMLAEYDGPACVESFHPDVVRYFRKNDPGRIPGTAFPGRLLLEGDAPCPAGFYLQPPVPEFPRAASFHRLRDRSQAMAGPPV